MKKFNINAQKHIIDSIVIHLTSGTFGLVIAKNWNYERIDDSNIFFELKENCVLNPHDLFWFGYLTNQ